jgi:hypothetical protein
VKFSAETIMKWRQSARQTWTGHFPEEAPEGWSISPSDPSPVVNTFKGLRLRPGLTLRAYQYRWGHDSHTIVLALPAGERLPPVERRIDQPVRPPAALAEVMEAIEGDNSLPSYMQASILRRELKEFGAFGHGSEWNLYHILGQDIWVTPPLPDVSPTQATPSGTPQTWEWLIPQPEDYRPGVERKNNEVCVTFYVYSALGQEQISRCEDVFEIGKYSFQTNQQTIAVSSRGYII